MIGWKMEEYPSSLDFTQSYMEQVHHPDLLLQMAVEELKGVEFDTLVGTGLSGTIAVVQLARQLGKHYLVVRKPNDGSHSYQDVEGVLGKRWLFVDDLISSGSTLSRVYWTVSKISHYHEFPTEFVGVFLYANGPVGFLPLEDGRVNRA